MFRAPVGDSYALNADRAPKVSEKIAFLLKIFLENYRKSIDGGECECSLRNLSPSEERFFEIYFVRLIGTPNQNTYNR